ncbi:asparagine synthase (glutamine-hydrolysing) [Phycisphaerales bacterium]|nr:asparagine synthase (glutamine-hydrolysing) [Phycisphaerales bacterium]
MCGIAGILRIYPPGITPPPLFDSIPEAWLDTLDQSIKHRGPDGQGRFRDRVTRADGCTADVALVHRRLSILDHAGGAQPMLSPPPSSLPPGGRAGEGSAERQSPPFVFQGKPHDPVHYRPIAPDPNLLAVVFNGCIYNHRELRKELESAGHAFHTNHSDTEVLLHGWRAWGEGLCDRLNGMFAFMLWDRQFGTMLRARDSFGEKPLYTFHVATQDGWINLFLSMPPESTGIAAQIGPGVIPVPAACGTIDWLRFGATPSSPVPGARTVEPARYEVSVFSPKPIPHKATAGQLAQCCLPRVCAHGALSLNGLPSLPRQEKSLSVAELDRLLRQSVLARLDADVPVGVFLSGGVDSSLIAYYACEAHRDIRTFTVRMPDAAYDESHHAAAAAQAVGSDHVTLECSVDPAADLVRLIHTLGLPFGDSSLLPAFWVCRAARSQVTVALSGDGGDELFLGYDRYFAPLAFGLRGVNVGPLVSFLDRGAAPKSFRSRLSRLIDALANLGYFDLISIFPDTMLRQLVVDPQAVSESSRALRPHRPFSIAMAQSLDLFNYLPDDLLRKTDTASMAVALEVRCPFLDPAVVTAALSAEIHHIAPHNKRKGLLRQLARKYLPASIVDRPKMGFAIPIGDWFRSDYGGLKQLLLDHLNSADPFPADLLGLELNRAFITQMVNEHMAMKRDHSQRLYMLLVLAIWCRWMRRLC